MTEEEIVAFVARLPRVQVVQAREGDGSPEVAWGDTFFMHAPGTPGVEPEPLPFATVVTKDYPGWDEHCDLNRPGVFRLNIGVGRQVFEQLLGYSPGEHGEHHERTDYTVLDRFVPNPSYARQGWVSVLVPGEHTAQRARELLVGAWQGAERRRAREGAGSDSQGS